MENRKHTERYLDPSLPAEERAADLLARLTPKEKMAQLCCAFLLRGDTERFRTQCRHGIGTVTTLDMRRAETLEEAAQMQRTAQQAVMEQSRFHIPAIFHMEGLCGAFIPGAASLPAGIGRGSSWDPNLEKQLAQIVGRQERAVGITQTLAPVLDISRDSRMGRQGETYGEDPTLAARMGTAFVQGIQEGKASPPGTISDAVAPDTLSNTSSSGTVSDAVGKHFLGFHNSEAGIHGAASDTPDRLLQEVYGKPFQAAIREAGLRGVMPCYCTIDGEPVSASRKILTGLLREEMGFDGLVVSDYSAIANVHHVQRLYESETEAGLHFHGRPVSDDLADSLLNGLLECWNPSEYGAEAIVSVLTGAYNPSGKLPLSVARSAGQIPVYYNHPNGSSYHQGESIGFADYVDLPHTPRYFFGYGLSYTSFAYEGLTIHQPEIAPEDTVQILKTVKNTGSVTGTEIVQLYVRDCYARMVRPVQELAYLDENMHWLIEAGEIDVLVGASSNDIRLTGSFRIRESRHIQGRDWAFWAEASQTAEII